MSGQINIFNIKIDNLTLNESVREIVDRAIENKKRKRYEYVVTPNVDHIVNLYKDKLFRQIYSSAKFVLADGAPIVFASRLLRKPITEKVSGSDLTPKIFKAAQELNLRIYIFGSLPGVAEQAIKRIHEKYNYNFPIDSYSPKFGFEKNIEDLKKSICHIIEFKPDILLVSLGSPKGEKFIYQNLKAMKVPMSIQVGASIDFVAERIKRAPKWMQKIGLEWLYRFAKEPKRMGKRYFINDSRFIAILFREFIKLIYHK